jgi:glycosyltransferase involved in cell wall biosynthesis
MESREPLHVVYIITKLELGGAQKVCLSLMHGLKQAGHHVSLISGNQGALVSEISSFDSVVLLSSFKREVSFLNFFTELKNFFLIIKQIRQLKKKYPDLIVHTHSTKAGLVGRWAALFARVKKRIHTIHGFGFYDYQSKWTKKIIIALEYITSFITAQYVCVSQKDYDQGATYFPRFSKKAHIIRAAVAWDTFIAPAQKVTPSFQDSFTIGAIACFKPQKNLIDLLQAFKLVHDRVQEKKNTLSIKLQIIGDGALRTTIEEWIHTHKMSEKIELLGWQHNVIPYLQKWDIFALSSLWEGLPCSIIEARLSKLPVVAYDVGGIAEVIFNHRNGFLVKPGSWQLLAEKIILLISNPALYQTLALFDDELTDFKDSIMVQKHISLYHYIK